MHTPHVLNTITNTATSNEEYHLLHHHYHHHHYHHHHHTITTTTTITITTSLFTGINLTWLKRCSTAQDHRTQRIPQSRGRIAIELSQAVWCPRRTTAVGLALRSQLINDGSVGAAEHKTCGPHLACCEHRVFVVIKKKY